MADEADRAQANVDAFLAGALERVQHGLRTPGLGYVFLDGLAHCRECDKPVPMARVKAVPNSGLCVRCQEEAERCG